MYNHLGIIIDVCELKIHRSDEKIDIRAAFLKVVPGSTTVVSWDPDGLESLPVLVENF